MPSAIDKRPSVICFVGRPLDPLKGLITFLDAVERLLALPSPPNFATWIVGGDDDEMPTIGGLLAARPRLLTELTAGRFMVWGRVRRHALPEIYRRCAVVAMPSLREQFGLVAIEAMACGVPVVGTRQGGLDDTILAGLTGAKAEVDQPEALAAALLLYLRGPGIQRVHGFLARSWAARSFAKATTYDRMADLYTGALPPKLDTPRWDLRDRFNAAEVENRLDALEAALNDRISAWDVVAARHHVLARVETAKAIYAVKIFRDRPSVASVLFPAGTAASDRTARDFVDNAVFHSANPLVPALVAADLEAGFAVYPWLDTSTVRPPIDGFRAIRRGFANYGAARLPHAEELAEYSNAIETFLGRRDEASLTVFDVAAAALNRTGQAIAFDRRLSHPTAELQRTLICLETKGWPIPPDIVDRMRMVINRLQAEGGPLDRRPKLCHGDLSLQHLVTDGSHLRVIDTEHSTFAVGELDLGTYAASEAERGTNLADVATFVREATDSPAEAVSAFQWTAHFLIHNYLERIHQGEVTESHRSIRRTLYELALVLS